MSVPLKLKDSAAPTELQKFSSTEENYLAYQTGLYLAEQDSTNTGRLSTSLAASSYQPIGTFVNTSYDSAVGTPSGVGGFLPITTVGSVIGQNTFVQSNADSDVRRLIYSDSDTSVGYTQTDGGVDTVIPQLKIREMDDSDQIRVIDRINSTIYTNDYPGTYKLSSSGSLTDYAIEKHIFSDTRTDGTTVPYYLHKRTTMTAPTAVRPFAIKRSNGDGGDYQGLQQMTDRQIGQSLGTVSKNRIGQSANPVGSYLLLSSAQGTPVANGYSGSWSSKGTATDTRQAVTDATYTRSRVSTYARQRDSTYSQDYTRDRASTFSQQFIGNYTRNFSDTYTRTRTSIYSPGFVGDYIGNYTTERDQNFTRVSTRTSTYSRTSTRDRNQDFQGTSSYTGNFLGNYAGDYLGVSNSPYYGNNSTYYWRVVRSYYGNSATLYVVFNGVTVIQNSYSNHSTAMNVTSYPGNDGFTYERGVSITGYTLTDNWAVRQKNYNHNFQGVYSASYTRTSTRQNQFVGDFAGNYVGNFSRTLYFDGDFTGDFVGDFTRNSTRTVEDSFSRNFVGDYVGNFTRTRTSNYTRERNTQFQRTRTSTYAGNFTGDFTGNYGGNFLGNYVGTAVVTLSSNEAVTNVDTTIVSSGSRTITYLQMAGYFTGYVDGGQRLMRFYRAFQYNEMTNQGPAFYTYLFMAENSDTGDIEDSTPAAYGGSYGSPEGGFAQALSRLQSTSSFLRNTVTVGSGTASYTRTSTRTSTRNSTRASTRTSSKNFEGNYTGDFTGNYSRNFVGNYTTNFQRTRVSSYIGASEFSRDFVGNYVGNYSSEFLRTSTRTRSENYIGNYTGNYARSFEGNYSRTFTGNYAGTEIGSSPTNIETYTLYVRTA